MGAHTNTPIPIPLSPLPFNFLILAMSNYSSDPNSNPTRILHPQDPNNSADPQVPLRNLSLVRTRINSLQRFLSQSINTDTPLTSDQIATVSNHIISAIHQTIANAAALVSFSQNSTGAVTQDPPYYPKLEPYAAAETNQLPDSKFETLKEDDDAVEDFDGGEIVELDAVEILTEQTHFCEICGKGFRRDANLRMHMRAHGDQFKTVEALAKPSETATRHRATRFSCPFEGCNRNKQHVRFRPLKSVVCVKNHFKRSHCPKMYTCQRCRKKHFSVLADLKSHVRHCGVSRWKCTCGTTFSRKDKLFSHVALFEGHAPALACDEEDFKGKQVVVEDEIEAPMSLMSENNLGNWFEDEELPERFFDDFGSIDNYCLREVLGFPPGN